MHAFTGDNRVRMHSQVTAIYEALVALCCGYSRVALARKQTVSSVGAIEQVTLCNGHATAM